MAPPFLTSVGKIYQVPHENAVAKFQCRSVERKHFQTDNREKIYMNLVIIMELNYKPHHIRKSNYQEYINYTSSTSKRASDVYNGKTYNQTNHPLINKGWHQ
jgi:hypothetical protein